MLKSILTLRPTVVIIIQPNLGQGEGKKNKYASRGRHYKVNMEFRESKNK